MARAVVKAAADVVAKWVRRAGSAATEYEMGVRNTPADWAALAKAATPAYTAGVNEAIAQNRYGKGIDAAGTAKWRDRSVVLGPARFAQGVGAAEPAYNAGIGPVLQTIANVDLPPRQMTGSEANNARVTAITKALRALKVGRR